MLEMVLIFFVTVWVIAPIPLVILYILSLNERKKYTNLVKRLLSQKKITPYDVMTDGLKVPPFGTAAPQQSHVVSTAVDALAAPAVQPKAAPVPEAQVLLLQEQQKLQALHEAGALTAEELAVQTKKLSAVKEPSNMTEVASMNVPVKPEAIERSAASMVSPMPVPITKTKTSAISVMLGVGVILVILAGLLFVRTSWETLSSFGKLLTLAAGSGLFFGASAMAQRFWNLKRTGMAFFSLGAAFLPISIWAAGYFSLLGEQLSGSTNPWLLTLSAAAFTVIAVVAVKIYAMTGWGIAALTGISITYLCGMAAILPSYASWTLSAAVFALLLVFLARPLSPRLPVCIARVLEPFSLVFTFIASLPLLYRVEGNPAWYGFGAFAAAAAFLSPVITSRMKQGSAIPMGVLTIYGFGRVLHPLLENDALVRGEAMYFALTCVISGVLFLLLMTFDTLPDETVVGYHWMYRITAGCSILIMLGYSISGADWSWLTIAAAAVLLAATLIPALRTKDLWLRSYAALETLPLLFAIGNTTLTNTHHAYLLIAVLCLGCGLLFAICRRLRTALSDYLFSVSMALCAMNSIFDYVDPLRWHTVAAIILLGVAVIWYLAFALEHNRQSLRNYGFVFLAVGTLALFSIAVGEVLLDWMEGGIVLLWSVLSLGIGFGVYYMTKRGFRGVRLLLFCLSVIPPLAMGICAFAFETGSVWPMLIALLAAAAAALVWWIFSGHGFRSVAVTGFASALYLVLEACYYGAYHFLYDGGAATNRSCASLMTAGVVLLLLGAGVYAASRWKLRFVGDYAVNGTAAWSLPAAALLFGSVLVSLGQSEWDTVYFCFGMALCAVAWLVSHPQKYLGAAVTLFSLILTLDALRQQCPWTGNGAVAVLIALYAGLTALFSYLGIVCREDGQKRALVLTVAGGIVPLWMHMIASEWRYTDTQTDWMRFLVPILLAGYVLHLTLWTTRKNTIYTIAAGLGMYALWIQPLFDFHGTYLEGKYHLLPLIAFGIVLRRLYGKVTGGNWLFGIGTYAMVRIGVQALVSEKPLDLLTVLICGLVIFVVAYYIKQKKWFLLGGISLCGIALRLSPGLQWWVYLLFAGVLLILIAAINEMSKQRGESLKVKVGRFWEDWEW